MENSKETTCNKKTITEIAIKLHTKGTIMIVQIHDKNEKRAISRKILEALTEWFEVDESREQYIAESYARACRLAFMLQKANK